MTLERLTHFLAAARHLNFTRAADELYVHQTSIGRSVAALEDELGVILFIRDRKNLYLTEAGEYLSREGERLLSEFEKMQREIRKIHCGISGKLSIIGFRFYLKTLTAYYKMFRDMYPNVELSVTEVGENDVHANERWLLNGDADLGLVFYRSTDTPDPKIECRRAFSDAMDLIASKHHPLAGRPSVRVADLSGETLLLASYMNPATGSLINEMLRRQELPLMRFQPVRDRPQTESEWLMQVSAGFGVSFMPRIAARQSFWDLSILPLQDIHVNFDLYIAYRRENRNPALKLFMDLLTKHPLDRISGLLGGGESAPAQC